MRMKSWTGILIAGLLLLCTACLDKEVEELLYIETDGSLTWTVLEFDVHSEEDDPKKREDEERAYLARAERGESAAAKTLRRIGATDVRTNILRPERPYSVRIEGRFKDPAAAFRGLFESCKTAAEVTLERDRDGRHELRFKIDPDALVDCGEDEEGSESPLGGLLHDGSPKLALVSGQFVDADGFELQDEGRVAMLLDETEGEGEGGEPRTEWKLVWKTTIP